MKKQLGYTLTELLVIVWFGLIVAAVGTVIYVAVHFISKFW